MTHDEHPLLAPPHLTVSFPGPGRAGCHRCGWRDAGGSPLLQRVWGWEGGVPVAPDQVGMVVLWSEPGRDGCQWSDAHTYPGWGTQGCCLWGPR